jgi:hypothetical protein
MARRPSLPTDEAVGSGLVDACCCPEEASQLAGARDDGHVVRLAAGAHPLIDAMQPVLGTVSDLQNMIRLALLTVLECRSDARAPPIVRQADSTSSRRANVEPVLVIEPWCDDSPDW